MSKILIAEDERDIRDLITFTLGFAGYEVVAASNGEEALNLARQEIPDLILMDVRMPRMTGYEACIAMKADANLKDIPVIFLTEVNPKTNTLFDADILKQYLGESPAAFLEKPIKKDAVLLAVQGVLGPNAG